MGAKTNFSNVHLFKNVLALQIMPIDLDNLLLTYVICCHQFKLESIMESTNLVLSTWFIFNIICI